MDGLRFNKELALKTLRKSDPMLAKLIKRVGALGLKVEPTQSPFEALAESIVHQQLHGKAAATIFGRVCALFPKGRVDPERLLELPMESLRAAGLSASKAAAMRDLAEKTLQGVVPAIGDLEALDNETIIERLTVIRGIGRWTVEMLLIFRLGRPDVLPVHDFGVRKGFAVAFGKDMPTPQALAQHGERWSPFRSVASWYLWRAADLDSEKRVMSKS